LIHYSVYTTINDVPKDWDSLVEHDILLTTPYLKALENASPTNISVFYIAVFKAGTLVGIAVVQRVQLYLKDMFRDTKVSCVKTFVKDAILKVLKGNILVVGNLTHTGQHGLYFNTERISSTNFYAEVFKGITELKTKIKLETNKTIRLILLKDFFNNDELLNAAFFQKEKLHKASVQPNMIMNIREDWCKNEDYVSCMNKKYRTRFRRAKKKLNSIACKEMNLEAIKANSKLLYTYYLNVSNNAKFNTFILPENHFYHYKLHLKDNFRIFGYYLKNELIGFFTLLLNGKQLETYFLGYHLEHQYQNQLYLNMLYDMAKFGIEHNFKTIVYARTAMEIKSSVGAKPVPMVMYLKHTNGVLNAVLKQVFRFMYPSKDWQERHPFS
jgi:hypothetical protein